VKSPAQYRWKLLGGCFVAALAWEFVYTEVLDPEGKMTLYLAGAAPTWLQWLHRLRPSLLAARLLNLFGFRFDVTHWNDNNVYLLVSIMISALIWTAILYGAASWLGRGRQRVDDNAAA